MSLSVQIKPLHGIAKHHLPRYAHAGDAGLDLYADLPMELTVFVNQRIMVETGVAIHIKDPGYVGLVVPRSGLGAQFGLVLGNAIGVIDSTYTGPLKVCLWNTGEKSYLIKPWQRIAQLLVMPVATVGWDVVEELGQTERGEGGFGSTSQL